MANYLVKNKIPFTLLSIILGIVLITVDGMVENAANTTIQWAIFIIIFIFIMYLQFSDINETITDEEYYPAEHGGFQKAPPLEFQTVEPPYNDGSFDQHSDEETKALAHAILGQPLINGEETKSYNKKNSLHGKPVFVVQPMMVVSEEEFNQKTNKNLNMKPQDNKPGLSEGPKKIEPVNAYHLHNIPQKYRAMVDDISSFAIRGEKKTLQEIEQKIRVFGHPFKVVKESRELVAFKFDFIRIPAEGYFGIKA